MEAKDVRKLTDQGFAVLGELDLDELAPEERAKAEAAMRGAFDALTALGLILDEMGE